jgi:Uma2 family endonuclease
MEVTSTEVQNNFGAYLKLAKIEEVYITRNGRRIAVLKHCEESSVEYSALMESKADYRNEPLKLSVEEFLKLTDASENRYELIDGKVFLLASPSYVHQRIVGELFNRILQWSQGRKCKPVAAPFDVTLTTDDTKNIVQPDIVLVCDQEKIDGQGRYNGIPTLVIEVLSESTRRKDLVIKLDLYMRSGVKEYWIANPLNREIYIYSFTSGEISNYRVYKESETADSEILGDFSIRLEQVFVE